MKMVCSKIIRPDSRPNCTNRKVLAFTFITDSPLLSFCLSDVSRAQNVTVGAKILSASPIQTNTGIPCVIHKDTPVQFYSRTRSVYVP